MVTASTATAAAPVTTLVAAAAEQTLFDAVGVLRFDGAGAVLGSSTNTHPSISVGTYTVGTDCTVTLTLSDVFTRLTTLTTTLATATSAGFVGLIVDSGEEIVLRSSNASGSGLAFTLRRLIQGSECSVANLLGAYGIVFNGVTVLPTGAISPVSETWRVVADGAGYLVADAQAVASSNPAVQATGTYTVNNDCTGNMKLTANSTTTAFSFVLVRQPGLAGVPMKTSVRTQIDLVATSGTVTGAGTGKLQ